MQNQIQFKNEQEERLMSLADNMAAAASTFNRTDHGYDAFIDARDQFKIELHNVMTLKSCNDSE